MSLFALTAHELQEKLKTREITAVELLEDVYRRVDSAEPAVQAYISLHQEKALAQAEAADDRLAAGSAAVGTGIPTAIKDNISVAGVRNTCGSQILADYVPPYNATVAEKLLAAGVSVIGKTNMDEFAMGSSTENSGFHVTRNPWDLSKVPGGSSGGSAAAVAAGEAVWALGSDTGGSIRQPAALCGIVGLKPTYGLVSRYGLVAFASSLDQIGPLTKDVTDCALLLQIIAGHDHLDSSSVVRDVPDYLAFLRNSVQGLRVGVPKEYFGEGLNSEVRSAVEKAIAQYEDLGAEVVEVSLPHTEYALSTYYLIAPAEASSNLARYDGVRYGYRDREAKDTVSMFMQTRGQGFGAEVKRRIMLGTYALSAGYYDAYYKKAQSVRTLIRQDFDQAFAQCDVIISPTTPTTAFAIGEKAAEPMEMYLSDIYTVTVNLAGLPGISVPCGLDSKGMPIGLQLIGRHFAEGQLLQAAYAYEQAAGSHLLRAPLEVKANG